MQPHKRIPPHFQTGSGHYWILAPRAPLPPGGQEIPEWDLGYRDILQELFSGHHYQAAPALQQLELLGVAAAGVSDRLLAEHILKQRNLYRFAKMLPVSGHGATGPSAPKPPAPPPLAPVGEFRYVSLTERMNALLASERGVAAVLPPEPIRSHELIVEVAGAGLESSQYLHLYREGEQAAVDRLAKSHDKDRHRSLAVFENLSENPRRLALAVSMQGAPSPLLLPLSGQVRPVAKGAEKPEWDNLLVPVKPLRQWGRDAAAVKTELLANGWLYVFWRGKLWRELAVDARSAMRDVRLDWYRGQYRFGTVDKAAPREAEGKALLSVWVPYRVNGAYQTGADGVRLAFSSSPWSWEQIEALEADAGGLHKKTVSLDALQSYSKQKSFGQAAVTGPIRSALLDAPPLQKRMIDAQRNQGIAVAYLQSNERLRIKVMDPAGKALADVPYELRGNASLQKGRTDATGCVEPADLSAGQILTLTVWPLEGVESERQRWRVRVGELSPLTEERGQQQRLLYLSGKSAASDDLQLTEAIRKRFMAAHQLSSDTELRQYLKDLESTTA